MKTLTLVGIIAGGAAVTTGVVVGIVFAVISGNNDVTYSFPNDFKFGAASAAYQIEGGWDADGKSPSIWDTLTHQNSHLIIDGSNGDVACNSYEFWRKDVDALKEINVSLLSIFYIIYSSVLSPGSILSVLNCLDENNS